MCCPKMVIKRKILKQNMTEKLFEKVNNLCIYILLNSKSLNVKSALNYVK